MLQKIKRTLNTPAYRLIAKTTFKNWILLTVNLSTNLLSILFEGSTLGILYLAISVVSDSEQQSPYLEKLLQYLPPINQSLIFIVLLVCALILQTLLAISNYGNKLSTAYLSAKIQPQVTGKVFQQIMSFSFACASRYKVGDLVFFANSASTTVNNQISILNSFLVNVSFTIVYSFILVRLSSILALIAVILSLTIVLIQRVLIPRLRILAKQVTSAQVDLSKRMTENIQALRLIHTFGTQNKTIQEVEKSLYNIQFSLQKRARILYLTEPILDVLPILALTLLAAIAYSLNSVGEAILPLLFTFLVALQRLSIRLRGLSVAFTQLANASAEIDRLNSILETQDKEFALIGAQTFESLETDIELNHVSLSYNNNDVFAIQNLSLVIPKHKVTALVGQSGAGKSSIVDLLLGLYKPTQGEILANGLSIYEYDQASWREKIGVVSQDTFIFNMSILENLRYGSPNCSFEAVVESSKAAQAHRFISDLPNGYDTIVGERGYLLSGGQRQRLALARALVKDPDILILDEATSALDSESERLIQDALDRFQENRTVIVIAHRLSTIVGADQIIVLDHGRLIEEGDHQSLVHSNGQYARYWRLQTTQQSKL